MEVEPSSTNGLSKNKSMKRKIDEALHTIDEALMAAEDSQPPNKKLRLPGSIYSTLAKYGIKASREQPSKTDDMSLLSRKAPHLTAILSRAASKKRKVSSEFQNPIPFTSEVMNLPGASEYRPSSTPSFLSRLSTFKLATYAQKPAAIDAVAAAKAGWVNDGKDRLVCGICRSSWIVASHGGMTRDAANVLLEKQRNHLTTMHGERCPWRAQQCDATIYCVPLKAPSACAKDIKKRALELDSEDMVKNVELRHPLTSSQLKGLKSALAFVRLSALSDGSSDDPLLPGAASLAEYEPEEPSEAAALISLFGWSLATTSKSSDSRTSTPITTRATSVVAGRSVPGTPRRVSFGALPTEPNTPFTARASPVTIPSVSNMIYHRGSQKDRDTGLLHCVLCQRKVGLWAFMPPVLLRPEASSPVKLENPETPGLASGARSQLVERRMSQLMRQRPFDLLKEHRPYCPYVVRSTSIPTLSTSFPPDPARPDNRASAPTRSNSIISFNFSFTPRNAPQYPTNPTEPGMVEGWRAILTVVLRNGLGRRQRQRIRSVNSHAMNFSPGTTSNGPGIPNVGEAGTNGQESNTDTEDLDTMEMNRIDAMVENVKAHGGRDLLKYVKSLFA